MRTSLKKLKGLYHKHGNTNHKDRRDLKALSQSDELAQASQDMQDMRDCYDSLLSAAAATANSSYEFSESLREMGACLLEKNALNDDEDSGRVLLMLGKMQYELQRLVDSYRSHVFQTITVPSESLLNELRNVEEMKLKCDEKRDLYEYMKSKVREKGKSRSGKGESFSPQQLQMARDDYDEEATLFIFRLKSLKQGQSRSLLTQAARHHAAQLYFFKKSLRSLEAVEPHVKLVAEKQHIDYHFGGLQDYESDDDDDDYDSDDDDDSYDSNDDGELSFDYGPTDRAQDVPISRNLMEVDQVDLTFPKVGKVEDSKTKLDRPHRNSFSFGANAISLSAPIVAENKVDKFEPAEKLRNLQPSLARKFHSYVLPTPLDKKVSVSVGSGHPLNQPVQATLTERTQNLWHSTPLEPKMYEKIMALGKVSAPDATKIESVLKESNNNNNNAASSQLPLPLLDGLRYSQKDQLAGSDPKKIKRLAFSGPITRQPWPTKPVPATPHQLFSGPLLRNPVPQHSSSPPKSSPGTSPTFTSSPKISELHELPLPPANSSRPLGLVGHSGPLVSRAQMQASSKSPTKSPLPKPPEVVPRSFSIPSRGPRIEELQATKPLDISSNSQSTDLVSPPLSPMTLSNN